MRRLHLLILLAAWTAVSTSSFAQAPNLASAGDFGAFTSAGAFNNTGTTTYTEGVLIGESHVEDAVSIQAANDLAAAYSALTLQPCGSPLAVSLGNNQILAPNVYCIGAAATLNGTLILDGQGDPNAVFIFKIDGALATGEAASVVLINSASFDNVFWQVTGRFDLGANSIFRGSVIGGGAIELLEGSAIVGRALTTAGAIGLHNNRIVTSEAALPVTLASFEAKKGEGQTARLAWATTAETNSDRFEIERSANGKIWNALATISAKGNSNSLVNYEYLDVNALSGVNMYRLKMIDIDETFTYSRIRTVENKTKEKVVLYPNPTVDKLILVVNDISKIQRILLNDVTGKVVFSQEKNASVNVSSEIDVKSLPSGLYIVQIISQEGATASTKILKK
jgi:hypothetical protein